MQNKNYFEDQNESLNSNSENEELENYPSNSVDNNPVHKTSFSVNSNIIQEEEKEINLEDQKSVLNSAPVSNPISRRVYSERKYVDNVRTVDMRGPVRRPSFANQSRENLNRGNYSEPENLAKNNDIENNSKMVENLDQENAVLENSNQNKNVVILPRFIVDKKLSERNLSGNNLLPRKNMDIRWMHKDNDENYDEAMYDEVKAINFKIKMILLVIVVLLSLLGYWIFSYFNKNSKDTASINELLTNNQVQNKTEEEKKKEEEQKKAEENKNNSNNSNSEKTTNSNETTPTTPTIPKTETTKKPAEISVQVLNGGAKSGTATDLSNVLKSKSYATKTPSNAKNSVSGVVIYYKSNLEKEITELSKVIPSTYGEVKLEKSDDVTKKYNMDVIVVVGK